MSRPRPIGILLLIVMALAPGACGSPSDTGPARRDLVAAALRFIPDRIDAPASEPFVIGMDNRDRGIVHDLAIYDGATTAGAIFAGEKSIGPGVIVYAIPPLAPGSYRFRCEIHPQTMVGTLVVSPDASPGTPSRADQERGRVHHGHAERDTRGSERSRNAPPPLEQLEE